MELKLTLLGILSFLCHANGTEYELLVVDEEVFSSCQDVALGTLDINGLLDLSEFGTTLYADGVTVSGNTTLVWDIQLEDRVTLSIKLLYFDRGSWMPTVFSLVIKDFCKSMYDENQMWYKVWTQHIKNDIKDKCVNIPGTKIMLDTYMLSLTVTTTGPFRLGRYKAIVMFHAYDFSGVERPTRICFEILGDVYKVKK
ncbi:uncharacterized protein [Drosophila suzukii]|uniref:Uncharacterized protein n=1 Tax=Drosophila suzukii TaxID=28584 RepID=A0AB39Z1G8_DROSZ